MSTTQAALPAFSRHTRAPLLLALALAFGLRLYRLGTQSLWYDETVSATLAREPVAELIRRTAGDIHPPGYYLLLHLWQRLTTPTPAHGLEFLLAAFSLGWGLLVVALLFPITRRLLDTPTALLAVWLAAINPFHLWYSQEVRMYTQGAALGLVCLWALLVHLDRRERWWPLIVYTLAGAAGLYTLYSFAFLLVALNLIALLCLGRPSSLRRWAAAQVGVLLLFAAWLPIVWRQMAQPPVPPWRVPWQSTSEGLAAVGEGLAALWVGQSVPGGLVWPWAAGVAAVLVWAGVGAATGRRERCGGKRVLAVYLLVPAALIVLITLAGVPVYHVRYLFTFAPAFLPLLSAALLALGRRRLALAWAALALVAAASLWSLTTLWYSPLYRRDDHRGAVAVLAQAWRPGDLILVNAGWVGTALATYWPQELVGPDAALPPAIAVDERVTTLASLAAAPEGVVVGRMGGIDGSPNLGWGDPASDFFALTGEEAINALALLAERHPRLWHYRLYDTVSDPDGRVRRWLAENAEEQLAIPVPGRDFLQIELYELSGAAAAGQTGPLTVDGAVFGDVLRLDSHRAPAAVHAGDTLYVDLLWTPLAGIEALPVDLSTSLRLYDARGALLAQADSPLLTAISRWRSGLEVRQPLALPVPAYAKPGAYGLELVVYRQDDARPLPPPNSPRSQDGQRWLLGPVRIDPATHPPQVDERTARFDYIDLLRSRLDRPTAAPGDSPQLELIWQPQPNEYKDAYTAVVELIGPDGTIAQRWVAPVGGADYPSSAWPDRLPVRDLRSLPLDPALSPGRYTLNLRLERSTDGLPIPALRPGRLFREPSAPLAELVVED